MRMKQGDTYYAVVFHEGVYKERPVSLENDRGDDNVLVRDCETGKKHIIPATRLKETARHDDGY